MSSNLLVQDLSVPLDGATTASVAINTGTAKLIVDELPDETQRLAAPRSVLRDAGRPRGVTDLRSRRRQSR